MQYLKDELEDMLKIKQMSSDVLETLLKARGEGEVKFKLIDIREAFEFTDRSIVGADFLFPTSMIQKYVGEFENMRDIPIILYCRTGSRTGYIMSALENMGMTNIVHLSSGILSYQGETVKGAKIPNQL
jgi:adenylyltransferase/sulfurtransferase